jgi:hypothetical protein
MVLWCLEGGCHCGEVDLSGFAGVGAGKVVMIRMLELVAGETPKKS